VLEVDLEAGLGVSMEYCLAWLLASLVGVLSADPGEAASSSRSDGVLRIAELEMRLAERMLIFRLAAGSKCTGS
jgi:hypothetical protein